MLFEIIIIKKKLKKNYLEFLYLKKDLKRSILTNYINKEI